MNELDEALVSIDSNRSYALHLKDGDLGLSAYSSLRINGNAYQVDDQRFRWGTGENAVLYHDTNGAEDDLTLMYLYKENTSCSNTFLFTEYPEFIVNVPLTKSL